MSSKELCCNGGTNGKDMALTERARSVLYTTCNLKLRVTCSRRTPLTQLSQIIECKLSDECELRIEHWSHMAWVEEETVAAHPLWVLRVVLQVLAIEHVDKVCTTHGATRVTTLSFLYS